MERTQLALLAVEALKAQYPDALCSLDYQDPLQLLISTRLAAQCTDARVNQVTPALFARFPTLESFARAAEQLYYEQDPTGEKRRQFVQEQLQALGVEVTEAVMNMIEGAVWEINTENKKALVQAKEMVAAASEKHDPDGAYREFRQMMGIGGGHGNG